MKLLPSLFTTDMVQQLLAGRKTMTRRRPSCTNSLVDGRRVSAKTWKEYDFDFANATLDPGPSIANNPGPFLKVPSKTYDSTHRIYSVLNPDNYDTPLIIWARETWRSMHCDPIKNTMLIQYKDSTLRDAIMRPGYQLVKTDAWKPGIHMPFEVCRLFLQVTGFKIERIQQISRKDAATEGVCFETNKPKWVQNHRWPEQNFETLWGMINGVDSWQRNDWVYVPSFVRIEKPAGIVILQKG